MNVPDPRPPDFSISIVSYNTRDLLRACLATVAARRAESEATLEVVVADNGSTDGSVAMVDGEFPWVRIVETGGNIGYGRGNNKALDEARGRYFVILNSDTEVEPGALAMLRQFMDAHPEAGAVGAHLILPDGSTQASCVREPGLLSIFWEQAYLNKILPLPRMMGTYPLADWAQTPEPRLVETACGACLCVRREAYRQISGFDPAFFMYFEDIDLCVRLRAAGWKIFFKPGTRIQHRLGASSSQWRTRARMIVAYNESRYNYFSRTKGRVGGAMLKALVLGGAGLRMLAWSAISWRGQAAREQFWIFKEVWRKTRRMALPSSSQESAA